MVEDRYHDTPEKTIQLATFLLNQGKGMTSRQVFDAGFRYLNGAETTLQTIGAVLNKLHQNDRFSVSRGYTSGPGPRMTWVHVKAIHAKKSELAAPGVASMARWRWLLTRKRDAGQMEGV